MVKKNVPKKLTFISIYFLGINGIIGSGAFLLPQSIYKDMKLLSVVVLLTDSGINCTVLCRFSKPIHWFGCCVVIFL